MLVTITATYKSLSNCSMSQTIVKTCLWCKSEINSESVAIYFSSGSDNNKTNRTLDRTLLVDIVPYQKYQIMRNLFVLETNNLYLLEINSSYRSH